MNKKAYIIPAIEIENMELNPLMEVSAIGGDAGIDFGVGDIPEAADSRFFEENDILDF